MALGVIDEVPNDQEVAGEAGLVEDRELELKALLDCGVLHGPLSITTAESLLAELAEVTFAGLSFRGKVVRVLGLAEFQFRIAAFGDRKGIGNRIGAVGE